MSIYLQSQPILDLFPRRIRRAHRRQNTVATNRVSIVNGVARDEKEGERACCHPNETIPRLTGFSVVRKL